MLAHTFLLLFSEAAIMELVDAAIGMGYGTVLSPLLLGLGYPLLLVVPSVLLGIITIGLGALTFYKSGVVAI